MVRNINDIITYKFLNKTHGFYISWALVYTFWFHPMEGDIAILIGFFYMFLLLTQLSLFNSKIHTNSNWIVFLEILVGFHGPAIAIMNGQEVWPMFLFGFFFMFVFTYMHALKLHLIVKSIVYSLYTIGIVLVYFYRGYSKIYEIIFIPLALYGGAFALYIILETVFRIKKKTDS